MAPAHSASGATGYLQNALNYWGPNITLNNAVNL